MLQFAGQCRNCGLDFSRFNVGDGPSALITMAAGALLVGIAVPLQMAVHMPLWLNALIWAPLTVGAVIGALRVTKAALLILEHRNEAHEGAIDQDEGAGR